MITGTSPSPARQRRGTTLVELVLVVAVLAAVAGLIIVNTDGITDRAPVDGTQASFLAVRDAILGRPDNRQPSGFLADVGRLPLQMRELFIAPAGVPAFSPASGIGWRGPYLATSTGAFVLDPANGFVAAYGNPSDPAVLDGWSTPIVIQVPDADDNGTYSEAELRHARLVSAGDDGVIQTPRTDAQAFGGGTAFFPLKSQCADDLLLYLRVADLRAD